MTDFASRIAAAVADTADTAASLATARLELAGHIAAATFDAGLTSVAAQRVAAEAVRAVEDDLRAGLGEDATPRLIAEAMRKGGPVISQFFARQVTEAAQAAR